VLGIVDVTDGEVIPQLDDHDEPLQFELTADNQWTRTTSTGSKLRLTTSGAASPSKRQANTKQTVYVLKIVKMESKSAGAKQWVTMDTKEGFGKELKAGVLRLMFNEVETQSVTKKSAAKAAEGTNDASTWNLWIAAMTVTAIVLTMSYLVANVGGRETRN